MRSRMPTPLKFDEFLLDPFAYELRRQGRTVRVERRPMDLLMLLIERRGELVTRHEISERLWGTDVFVDVDTSINTLVRKIRRALRDSAERPRFVQTVQGKGYRFIAEVEPVGDHVVLVVMPFENRLEAPGQEYVADGVTEETLAGLARIDPERLRVIGQTTSRAYRGSGKTIGEIGREVGAGYLVEGAVRGAAGRIRVTSTLTRVHDQVQIWTETYDRESNDLLGLQAELGKDIAEQIHSRVTSRRAVGNARQHTRNPRAYDLYLRGRYYFNQMTAPTGARALECFREATALDPKYALAWAGIADSYSSRLFNSDVRPSDVVSDARAAAARALTAGPDVAEAHAAVARVQLLFDWDWRSAETHLRRAVTLDSSSTHSHWLLGHALSRQERHDEALAAASRALILDPLDALAHSMAAQIAYSAGRFDQAAAHARASLRVEPDFWVGQWQLAQAYERMDRTDEAITLLANATRLSHESSRALSLTAYVLATAGRIKEAREILDTLERRARDGYVPPVTIALGYLGLNEKEQVLAWVERAVSVRDVQLIYLPWDSKWDTLRDEKRFRDLLRRSGLSTERES